MKLGHKTALGHEEQTTDMTLGQQHWDQTAPQPPDECTLAGVLVLKFPKFHKKV